MAPTPDDRAIVPWLPPHQRPEAVSERAAAAKLALAREAEAAARLAVAKARQMHAEMLSVGTELVLTQLQKYLTISQGKDFENSIGPLDPATILKMAEFVSKNYRLDTGQATENIAHAIAPTIAFEKMTQEQREQWRKLAVEFGGDE
jgi:hypothetical protein